MHTKTLFAAAAILVSSLTTSAYAQPGVTDPLMTNLMPWRSNQTNFVEGTVAAGNYWLLVERTYDPSFPNQQSTVRMWVDGDGGVPWPQIGSGDPIYFPARGRFFQKEEMWYNAVDWRRALPGSYVVHAEVCWPAGFGEYSGQWYPAGCITLDLPVTATPL